MPRSPKDNELIRATRRDEICRAASRVFAKKGFVGTKIADIAAEANLSHGLLYHYFRSKEEVYDALFKDITTHRPLIEKAIAAEPRAIDRLRKRVELWLQKSAERPEMSVMVTQALVSSSVPEVSRGPFLAHSKESYLSMVADVKQAQADGDADPEVPAEELATALTALVRGMGAMRFIRDTAFENVTIDPATSPAMEMVTPDTVMRLLRPLRRQGASPPRSTPRGVAPARAGTTTGAKKKPKKEAKKEKSRAA